MPIRMLRDWTDSDKVNRLSPASERFFIRLIMKADDFGIFYADPRLLRSNLFPLLIDEVSTAKIETWLNECYVEGLVVKYYAEDKQWIQVVGFNQRMDRARKKYPHPEDAVNPPESAGISGLNTKPNMKPNTKPKGEEDAALAAKYTDEDRAGFQRFQAFIDKHAPSVAKMEAPFTIDQFVSITKKFTRETVRDMILRMGNYKPLTKKNKSAYLTFINWNKNGFSNNNTSAADGSAQASAAVRTITNIKKDQPDLPKD